MKQFRTHKNKLIYMNYLKKQKLKYDFFIITTLVVIFGVGLHFLIKTNSIRKR